ncbi:MAG: NAD(P)-binding domain-containing protein, partial [Acidobacteria bacterium]|nr:NAD(P)-binding domain-containing protein [Acidobacteriota bacterium]
MNEPNESDRENPLGSVRLVFIGIGVMAESMIAGLLKRQLVAPAQISGSHPRAARRTELEAKYGIHVVESNREAVAHDDEAAENNHAARSQVSNSIVILAVKPQKLGGVLHELKDALHADDLV